MWDYVIVLSETTCSTRNESQRFYMAEADLLDFERECSLSLVQTRHNLGALRFLLLLLEMSQLTEGV